jgi:hypothetical protein
MKDLHYTTIATDRHRIVVSTWVEGMDTDWYKFTVDGKVIAQGPLSHPGHNLPSPLGDPEVRTSSKQKGKRPANRG